MTKNAESAPAQLNLSRRYEERLLREAFSKTGPVPALILTGFLGSGKTTVVNHILQTRGNLRVAVLVNEVGELDIDSLLISTGQNNAAVGVPSTPLAGGCACCQLQDDLSASLRQLRDYQQQFDYLVLETSGAANPAPMAEVLLQHGFHLDAVATVVDAEAAHVALGMETGKAQLEAADLIIVNKCDLVGLGKLADLEDRIAEVAPSIRVVRTRFGQAPLESIMDVQEVAPAADVKSLQGELGVLSHDTLPSVGKKWQVGGMGEPGLSEGGPVRKKARLAMVSEAGEAPVKEPGGDGCGRTAGHDPEHTHKHHDHSTVHRTLHRADVQSVSIVSESAISLLKLQEFVVQHLLGSTGIFRVKGLLQLSDRRRNRTVFHFHGLHRFEVMLMGPWESPPRCQLVFIGKDLSELQRIKHEFEAALHTPDMAGAKELGVSAWSKEVTRELGLLVNGHQRFQVAEASCSPGVLGFSSVGVPLKSIEGPVVNASVMRAVNNSGHMLIAGEVGTEAVFQGSGAQQKSRVGSLLLPVTGANSDVAADHHSTGGNSAHEAAAHIWEGVLGASRGALTTAFRHAGGCSCDIGDALRAMAEARQRKPVSTP